MKIIGNRTRPYAYTFRTTEKERDLIDEKIKASGLTMTEFIIRSITNKTVINIPNAGEILTELVREGNNLNQVVKYSFMGKASEGELLDCIMELKKLHRTIAKQIGGK